MSGDNQDEKLFKCIEENSEKFGDVYIRRSKPQTKAQRRRTTAAFIVIFICVISAPIISFCSKQAAMLPVGLGFFVVGIGVAFDETLNIGSLSFSAAGLVVSVYSLIATFGSEELTSFAGRYAMPTALVMIFIINVIAVTYGLVKRFRLQANCTIDALAKCIDIEYSSGEGARNKPTYCPTLRLDFEGASYTLRDGIFDSVDILEAKIGEKMLIKFNPDNPNEFYRQTSKTKTIPLAPNVAAIIASAIVFVLVVTSSAF